MLRLFFDTETTGFMDRTKPMDHPDQPHIIQLAMILTDGDYNEVGCYNTMIRPAGWAPTQEAERVHGISAQKAAMYGVPILSALSIFANWTTVAMQIVAHNLEFDLRIMQLEMARENIVINWSLMEYFCTMMAATPVCKLPPIRRGQYKWPRLSECYQAFFNEPLQGAHDALVDVRACLRVYRHLQHLTHSDGVMNGFSQA